MQGKLDPRAEQRRRKMAAQARAIQTIKALCLDSKFPQLGKVRTTERADSSAPSRCDGLRNIRLLRLLKASLQ